jgi:alpha-galactosidase
VDEEKFPRGMKALVDEIHGLGLKAGIYSSAGEPPPSVVAAILTS